MRKVTTVLSGISILGTQSALGDTALPLKDLADQGISATEVIQIFQAEHGITINLDDLLKVNYEDEGNEIQFETLDHLSVTVPIHTAKVPSNKGYDGT